MLKSDNAGERREWGEGGGPILDGRDEVGEKGAGREGKVTALAEGVEEYRGEGLQAMEGNDSSWPPQTPLVVGTNKARQPPSLPPQASLQSVLKGGSFFQLSPNPPRLNSQKGAGAWTWIQGPTRDSAPTEEFSHILASVQDCGSSPFS
ncbi:hypothetical protein PPACK8108_LOCUS16966 [Phakopsora pachyrhizi]|uniref:Uncharacterized protein n=1 Tax=Phakopsora pachyrhizi TaxID=170000 RepID=A0AAV0BC57_PHAPC|nr:hypothetical protein PPACK8108_LOCUS16966 [Phakopsora pachyrhizi]